MSIQLSWYSKDAPDASGRRTVELKGPGPFTIGRREDNAVVVPDGGISRLHATLTVVGDDIYIADNDSANGTRLDGREIETSIWPRGARVEIGSHVLEVLSSGAEDRRTSVSAAPPAGAFPPPAMDRPSVSVQALKATGLVAHEIDYLALGSGIGSFVWIDHLRCFGVAADRIKTIGVDASPYGKYERLCRYSQIPRHERLRSNSISTPDNIWGFPGYASRESWREFNRGNWGGLKYIAQVFGEPTLTESYTPRAGDVFVSMDVEARRIGWDQMWVAGRILKVRKTDDGRFAVAYRVPAGIAKANPGLKRNQIIIARNIHLSMGYPASRFLDDIQDFKRKYPQSDRVVNAYEQHDDVYDQLEKSGGIVLVRGRGIVASRILQRLWEARKKNPSIQILQIMRSPITEGAKYDLARRFAANDIEYQPFNWPKSCWGGTLRKRLEDTPPDERWKLMKQWGGTTTADREDWDKIIADGKREGWYKTFFGNVSAMELEGGRIKTSLSARQGLKEKVQLEADYVIDCTGLIANLEANPVLRDLIQTYGLRRNRSSGGSPEQSLSGLFVTNDFEVEGLRNGDGHAYAAGVMTVNGPYAAVDSFLGLQYSALRSVDHMMSLRAPGLTGFGPLKSFTQWRRWCAGQAP